MITLIEATVNKYKSFQKSQTIQIDDKVTVLVGMNEAGKTVLLEAIGKMNYFDANDAKFQFDITQDYPRKELVKFQKDPVDTEVVQLKYSTSEGLGRLISSELGPDAVKLKDFTWSYKYKEKKYYIGGLTANFKTTLGFLVDKFKLTGTTKDEVLKQPTLKAISELTIEDAEFVSFLEFINKIINSNSWDDRLSGYIWVTFVKPRIPKFWYFDDYYQLDGRINLNDLKAGIIDSEKAQTINALLDLAGVELEEILEATDFENFTAQLEAASNELSDQMFKYWTGNSNLNIEFQIEKVQKTITRPVTIRNPSYPNNTHTENVSDVISEIILNIRVRSLQHKITLPLHRRSKGFNWFFSFIVWFSKIKSDKASSFILLFDEPGLNLHALAQANLLNFIEDLSNEYQIIYSTHSPFMIESNHLERVRTIVETTEGSIASETIQEKDPNTLFPLQAALGYDIAQNLFVGKNNLLVEGPADLIYLNILSNLLIDSGKTGLKKDIVIVPAGGLDKVSTFISLLRGSKLNIVCLLDSFIDPKGKQRLTDLVAQKIIKEKQILFFDQFSRNGAPQADIEDVFSKDDYLKIFNNAFTKEFGEIKSADLNKDIKPIILQINQAIKKDRFNHYTPAYKLLHIGVDGTYFSEETLSNFEQIFIAINNLFA